MLLTPLHKTEDAERIADKIIVSMEEPISLPDDNQVLTSLSIGIAVFPDHGATPDALLNAADGAMYQAKRLARGAQHTAGSEHFVADVQIRS
ncbi:RNase II stability modulator [compost metagenome]